MNQDTLFKIVKNCSNKITDNDLNNSSSIPFEHIYIDNFFDLNFANQILNSFPDLKSNQWEKTNDKNIEVKMRSKWSSEFDIPDHIIDAIRIMNSAPFLKALSKALHIPKLIPDPYFTGGGLNVTVSGGLLDVHIDGNYHDATGLHRRVNAILYLNPGWKEGWGGEFGLYNNNGDRLVKKIAPIHNRFMAFDTNDYSYHGLPDPLNFPIGQARRSIILYYYTKDPRPGNKTAIKEPHSALWKKKGWTDKKGNKTRNFH
ncbi:proline hydroxylase [Bacteroidetes bacterium SCGC AAA795-G10]|nr:proline hydroxylase [Bacteroidetes bacterium SCGC AAA795-G10]